MEVLVWADENGIVSLEDEAKEFVALAVEAIRKKLRNDDTSFDLMPYRHGGHEFLGLDCSDSLGNGISFTFYFGSSTDLPEIVPLGIQYDVLVRDFTDALHLIRSIAIGVKGNSIVRV